MRVEPDLRKSLDAIADSLDRDRSYVVNAALAAYVDVHRWQVEHIQQGLREAKAGRFAGEARVKRTLSRLAGK